MAKTFKVGVVGCGTISYVHLTSLIHTEGVKITALCDIRPERAETAAREYARDAKIYVDFSEMLEKEELDAVHILTPHYLHAKMTIEALSHGVNVLLEKPMCISLSEISEMTEAEKCSTARASVCFQNRFNDSYLYAKDLIQKSGELFSAYATVFWYRDKNYYLESDWRGKYATEGGGAMINQAIHTLDILTSLLGRPISVTGTVSNHHLKDVIEVEDTAEGLVEFESGSRANFYVTTAAAATDSISVVLKSKSYRIDIRSSELFVNGEKIHFPKEESFIGKEYYGTRHPKLIKEFYRAIETGCDMPVSLESAASVIRLILATQTSRDKKIMI